MCSITGSFSLERLEKLVELNNYRGMHSHSLFAFDDERKICYWYRGFGQLVLSDHSRLPKGKDVYLIAHQQAPTTEARSKQSIHPAQTSKYTLWHNGIIKDNTVKKLQDMYDTDEAWDTKLLLKHYKATKNFDDIDGTFACVMHNAKKKQLYIFRNEISPLFCTDEGDISSTKFDNSFSISANLLLTFNPGRVNMLKKKKEFKTVENPYFFG